MKSQSIQTTGCSLEKILAQCRIVRETRGASERFVRFLVSIQQSQQMPTRESQVAAAVLHVVQRETSFTRSFGKARSDDAMFLCAVFVNDAMRLNRACH
jgi:hypothetical protein